MRTFDITFSILGNKDLIQFMKKSTNDKNGNATVTAKIKNKRSNTQQ